MVTICYFLFVLPDLETQVRPSIGPKSGGTSITITGLFHNVTHIYVGPFECNITVT